MTQVNRNMDFAIKFYTADSSALSRGMVAVREERAH
jgi:hypothetical protein